MLRVIEELAGDWRRLDQRIDGLSGEIEALARQDQACSRLMTVPGIGPIISSAMVAAIGTGDVFSKGRDFGAWLGLVPKQISTGDRTILGKISRRGNRYLRVLFVQAAWVVLVRIKNWERYGLKSWIEAANRRSFWFCLRGARRVSRVAAQLASARRAAVERREGPDWSTRIVGCFRERLGAEELEGARERVAERRRLEAGPGAGCLEQVPAALDLRLQVVLALARRLELLLGDALLLRVEVRLSISRASCSASR